MQHSRSEQMLVLEGMRAASQECFKSVDDIQACQNCAYDEIVFL